MTTPHPTLQPGWLQQEITNTQQETQKWPPQLKKLTQTNHQNNHTRINQTTNQPQQQPKKPQPKKQQKEQPK